MNPSIWPEGIKKGFFCLSYRIASAMAQIKKNPMYDLFKTFFPIKTLSTHFVQLSQIKSYDPSKMT
jgi:hypothetical protein